MRKIVAAFVMLTLQSAMGYDVQIDLKVHKTVSTCAAVTGYDAGHATLSPTVGPNAVNGTYTFARYVGASVTNGTVTITVSGTTGNKIWSRSPANGQFGTPESAANALPRTWQTKCTSAPAGSGWAAGDVVTGSTIEYTKSNLCDGGASVSQVASQTVIIGDLGHTLNITGAVEADDCIETHTVTVTVNGSVVASGETGGEGAPFQYADAAFVSTDNLQGQSYDISVDGTSIASGTISYTCGEGGCSFYLFNIGHPSCDATPTPTPTPTPTATPTPSATATPNPTATPAPTAEPGPSGPPGPDPVPAQDPKAAEDVYGSVYADVRQALNDSGNQDTNAVPADGSFTVGDNHQEVINDRNLNHANEQIETSISHAEGMAFDAQGRYTEAQSISLPLISGTQYNFDLGYVTFATRSIHIACDLTPYQTWIELFRNCCLFAAYLEWWFWAARVIRSGIA